MRKKKIAVIGARGIPATYGGIEKHCEMIYPVMVKNGVDIEIYSRKYYCEDNMTDYKGVKVKIIPVINIRGFEAFIHSFISTILAVFSDADILHYHAQGPALFSFIPRVLSPKKKICFTCHGIDKDRDKWGKIAKMVITAGEIASARFPHARIGVSEFLKNYYSKKYCVEMTRIYNGVEISEPLELNNARKFGIEKDGYFLFVGRLVPEKAPDILIKAFRQVNTDKKLVIAGDSAGTDDYVRELKEFAQGDDRIIFTSYIYGDDLKELYSNAFAYASASKLEGLPLTVLEAMSFSLPAVLSDIEPHTEVLNQGYETGISFKTNSTEACKAGIEEILSLTQEKISSMKKASKELMQESFDWEKVAFQTLEVLNNS